MRTTHTVGKSTFEIMTGRPGGPLITWNNYAVANGMDLSPDAARALAAELLRAAQIAEEQATTTGKRRKGGAK